MNYSEKRMENKYLISKQDKVAILKYISAFCKKDPHGIDGKYWVDSIYFDTKGLRSFNENIDGNQIKTKYRIRYYNKNLDNIKAEIKKKIGTLSSKLSFQIKLDNTYSAKSLLNLNNNEFISRIIQDRLEPKVHIRYLREAFLPKIKSDIRITFDSKLQYRESFLKLNQEHLVPYHLEGYIMELKYSEPNFWILKLLADLKTKKVSFSKYCNTLQLSQKKN
jgi:SPX domain protein involved in polyphosphate accumulation